MKLKIFLAHLLWLSLSLNTVAIAAPNVGVYAGAHVGKSKTNLNTSDLHLNPGIVSTTNNTNNSSFGWNNFGWDLFAGYRFNANLGLELDYTQYHGTTFDNIQGVAGASADATEKAGSLLGVFIFPFTSALSIYAKGGFAYGQEETNVNGVAANKGITNTTQHGFAPMFGIGGSYEFYPSLSLDLYYSYLHGNGKVQKASFAGLGLMYAFG